MKKLYSLMGAVMLSALAMPAVSFALTTDANGYSALEANPASVNVNTGASADVQVGGENSNVSTDTTTRVDASINSPERVSDENNLKVYASNLMKDDENIENIKFDDSKIDVTYKSKGKFLLVFPVKLSTTAEVDANGAVRIKYPWYHFLINKAEGNANLEARLRARVEEIAKVNSTVSLTASQKAEIANRLRSVLRDNFNAGTEASASGSAAASSY